MRPEIAKIILADDAAGKRVEAARTEAQDIRALAQLKATDITARRRKDIAGTLSGEIATIFEDARSKAQRTLKDADHYLEGLREKKELVWDELLDSLLRKVTGA